METKRKTAILGFPLEKDKGPRGLCAYSAVLDSVGSQTWQGYTSSVDSACDFAGGQPKYVFPNFAG